MSNGYYRFVRIETEERILTVDAGWGGYPEVTVCLTVNTPHAPTPSLEIALTRAQWNELMRQAAEYPLDPTPHAATEARGEMAPSAP